MTSYPHIYLYSWVLTLGKKTEGGMSFFVEASESKSGLSATPIFVYTFSAPAPHFLFQNKTHFVFLWQIASGTLSRADVSKTYTSISVQLATWLIITLMTKHAFVFYFFCMKQVL